MAHLHNSSALRLDSLNRAPLLLQQAFRRKLLESIKRTVGDISRAAQLPVLLTSMDIRRYVRKLIEQDLYELPVISYQELTSDINVQPLARVELA